ncbi:MAG: hypothetical protein ABSG32_22740 [Terriglobia bacterium]
MDERAGLPHISYLPKGETLAYIPDELLKCVVFLGYEDIDKRKHFAGSAFWISRPGPEDIRDTCRHAYLITAWHVVDYIQKRSIDGRVYMRVNTKNGVQEWHEIPLACWKSHPNLAVDIAVMKIGIAPDLEHRVWPMESCVINENLNPPDSTYTGDRKVELGDEVCFAGLFFPHSGIKKNIPVVRIGNIASLRNEPVLNRDNLPMDVYLVESHSIGGLSGSPVFIDIITAKGVLPPNGGYTAAAYEHKSPSRFMLFGLVHGHFGEDLEPDSFADDGKDKVHINTGMAMVVPAEKINEALEQFKGDEELEITEARQKKSRFVVPDNKRTQ